MLVMSPHVTTKAGRSLLAASITLPWLAVSKSMPSTFGVRSTMSPRFASLSTAGLSIPLSCEYMPNWGSAIWMKENVIARRLRASDLPSRRGGFQTRPSWRGKHTSGAPQ